VSNIHVAIESVVLLTKTSNFASAILSLRSWQLPGENTQIADLLMETMSDWIPKIVAKQQEVDLFHTLPVRMSSLTLGMRYFLRLH